MPQGVYGVLISLVVGAVSGYISSLIAVRQEKAKLAIELRKAYAIELFKKRLETYSEVMKILGILSGASTEPLNIEKARQAGNKLNEWLYSVGGLCADMETRGALTILRNECLFTNGDIDSFKNIHNFMKESMLRLRRDLDIEGLKAFNPELPPDSKLKNVAKDL